MQGVIPCGGRLKKSLFRTPLKLTNIFAEGRFWLDYLQVSKTIDSSIVGREVGDFVFSSWNMCKAWPVLASVRVNWLK